MGRIWSGVRRSLTVLLVAVPSGAKAQQVLFFIVNGIGLFDAFGSRIVSLPVGSGASGIEIELQSFGFYGEDAPVITERETIIVE